MLQRLVSMAGTLIGLVGRRPSSVLLRRRFWGWDIAVTWAPEEDDEPLGFAVGPAPADDEEE